MIRIERIELLNFKVRNKSNSEIKINSYFLKSYKSCEVNSLSFGANVICGPNGSGKSGLLESICFALGLRSSKLRTSS